LTVWTGGGALIVFLGAVLAVAAAASRPSVRLISG
jgi:hypothetical protein